MDATEVRARVIELNAERLNAIAAGNALIDETKGDFSAEDRAKWDRIQADISRISAARDVLVQHETQAREEGELREAHMRALGQPAVERAEVTEMRTMRDWLANVNTAARSGHSVTGFEIDVARGRQYLTMVRDGMTPDEARALAWDTGSIASGVPTTTAASLYQKLEASIAGLRMPTTKIMTTSGEQMKFPRINAHGIATQVSGQGTTLAGTDPTFLSLTLDAYEYGQLVKVHASVLSDVSFDVRGFLTGNIARALGRVIDTDLITGSGSGKPNGMMTAITGSGTIASGGTIVTNGGNGIPSYEKYIDLKYSVNDAYRSNGAAWLMHDLTAGQAQKLRDGAGGTVGAVLWQPSLTAGLQEGVPDRFLGHPVYTDPNVASLASDAKAIAFGDWSGYFIRTVGNIVVDSDASRYFDTREVGFRGWWRVDGDLQDTTAVNAMKISVT